ncbi:DUF2259 domain-containing protein [Pararhizobium sp.]|uniref:DUF2259 domain-containing protein n=1 Tax=Pararhizobium sp. TaxID=1977563 RepID=UPI0027157F63|nr:DUF2259 domain-containing protein [Pararhizobium sp.]MDO9417133.1 DUF2259 domain-containing protein [Pararhizobium sp.]
MSILLRTTCATVLSLLLLAGRSFAADISSLNIIGFSPDSSVFAFEEYGVLDGSGFPYSNIYFVDTVNDTFLPGTPVRVRIEKEASLDEARSEAATKAKTLIGDNKLAASPGHLVAFNPISEVDSDPFKVRYFGFPSDPIAGGAYTLQLEQFPLPPSEKCKGLADAFTGFRLKITEFNGQAANIKVREDTGIPESRGCPVGYRLGAVVTNTGATPLHIALVQVNTEGFEGKDGRWIAVPVRVAP